MLKWSVVFFIVAIVAAVFGFTTIAGASFAIAKILFFIFLVLFIITMVMALMAGKSVKNTLES